MRDTLQIKGFGAECALICSVPSSTARAAAGRQRPRRSDTYLSLCFVSFLLSSCLILRAASLIRSFASWDARRPRIYSLRD